MDIYKKQTLSETFSVYFDRRMLRILLLGIISGFPWVLIGSSLSLWLKEDGLSRSAIGWAGLIFIGGCAGSTTCGIKVFRIQILWLFIINEIKKSVYPRGVFPLSYNKEKIGKRFISSVISFIFLYFLIFFLVAMLLSFTGLNFITSFSGAATAISNVGPGLGDMIGPRGNFGELSNFAKWILSFSMLLGRLEIFTLLVLFFPAFWKN